MFGLLIIEGLKQRLLCRLGLHKWHQHRVLGERFCVACFKSKRG